VKIDLSALPTKSWRSHALLRAGIAAAAKGNHEDAEGLFIEALRDDPNNLAARVNFAGELMVDRDGDPSNDRFAIKMAIEQLEAVLDALTDKEENESIYFAALYRLASAKYDLGEFAKALELAKKLDAKFSKVSDVCHGKANSALEKRRNERMKAFIQQSYAASKTMLVGMQLEANEPGVTLETLKTAPVTPPAGYKDKDWVPGRVPVPTAQYQYNYACALAVYLRVRENVADREKIEEEAVERLRLAIRMKADLRARARVDVALTYLRDKEAFKKVVAEPPKAGATENAGAATERTRFSVRMRQRPTSSPS
jgi:tetratricopeptide (TPR) repeat protein